MLLVASNEKRDGLIHVQQDAKLYVTVLEGNQRVEHTLDAGRHAWVHVARGSVHVNGQLLRAGDGAAITSESKIEVSAAPEGEVLLFDLG